MYRYVKQSQPGMCHVLIAADQTSGAGKVGMTDSVKDAISRTQFHW